VESICCNAQRGATRGLALGRIPRQGWLTKGKKDGIDHDWQPPTATGPGMRPCREVPYLKAVGMSHKRHTLRVGEETGRKLRLLFVFVLFGCNRRTTVIAERLRAVAGGDADADVAGQRHCWVREQWAN
jgi:hypothetical protein